MKFAGYVYTVHRVGKHASGNILDGKEHKEFPEYAA
jgi:hypothetical protein